MSDAADPDPGADPDAGPDVDPDRDPHETLRQLLPGIYVVSLGLFFYEALFEPERQRLFGVEQRVPLTLSVYTALAGILLWINLRPGPRPPPEELDGPICQNCLDPYVEGAHFCPRCAAPLTSFATTAWYESIHAAVWCLGHAAHGPTRPVHKLGLQILAAPVFLVLLWAVMPLVTRAPTMWEATAALGFFGAELGQSFLYLALYLKCVHAPTRAEWMRLPPEFTPTYGSPPWWTYDRWWFRLEDGSRNAGEHDLGDHDGVGDDTVGDDGQGLGGGTPPPVPS